MGRRHRRGPSLRSFLFHQVQAWKIIKWTHKSQKSAWHCLIWCLLQRTCILELLVIIFVWVMIHLVTRVLYWWQINVCGFIKHVFLWMCDCFAFSSSEYKQMLLWITSVWISRVLPILQAWPENKKWHWLFVYLKH